MKNKFFLSLAILFLAGVTVAHAQTGSVAGTVTDAQSGESLPGANVFVVSTERGASTGADGTYEISGLAPGTYQMRVSYIGYEVTTEEVEVEAGETTQQDFTLAAAAKQLEGVSVVATGYGTQRSEDVTSAIATVDSSDFVVGSARDVGELLENQVAGLTVTQPDGDPRGGSSISLRGLSTIQADASPLVLIDGVPGDLDDVNRQNIQSVNILKGGAAAAIYGSRASNGVILIQTKDQGGGSRARVEYNATVTHERITSQPDFLSADEVRRLSEQYREQYPNLPISNYTDYEQNTNWQNEVLRNPLTHDHFLAFSAGDRETSYRASLGYENRQGIGTRSDNREMRGRIRVDHSMLDGLLTAELSAFGQAEEYWNGFSPEIWRQTIARNPTDQVRNGEGSWQERPAVPEYVNPLGIINETNGEFNSRELRLNGTVNLTPIDNLTISVLGARTSYNQVAEQAQTFQNASTTISGLDGTASQSSASFEEFLLEATGSYENVIGRHDFDVLGGYSWQQRDDRNFFAYNRNFPTDQFGPYNLGVGRGLAEGEAALGSGRSGWRLIGFFGRFNYNYDSRYLFMGSLRYEGNSKFGANNKWGAFPAMSAGWRIAQEPFMDGVDFVDALKLRVGYGVTGIAPGAPYQSLASFTYGGSFFNDGEWVQGLIPARNANPNLRWERKVEVNLGLDFGFFDQRLSGSLDVYRRTTNDLLFNYDVPVPPYLYDTITANVGRMRNEGIEATLSYNVIDGDDFQWSTNANFSTNRNELLSLSNDEFQSQNNFFNTGGIGGAVQQPSHRIEVGGPIGNFFGYKSVGVNEDGIWMIETLEGEVIPWTDVEIADKQVIGNGVPNYYAGWNHSFRYKNFDARVSMGGAFDFQILNETRMFYGTFGHNSRNWLEMAADEVDGQLVRTREAYVSEMVEDGDYWKIESVTLGYTLRGIAGPLSGSRVFVTGRNLLVFTGYTGIDPEVQTAGLTPGFDSRFKYPTVRSFTMGINLSL